MGDWSDTDIRTLRTMWQDGATATEIAATLGGGVSRGAVLGKIHRLGLKRSEDAQAKGRSESTPKSPPKAPAQRPVLVSGGNTPSEPVRRSPESSGPKPIWALGQCQCRWPMGDLLDPPGLFCGEPTADGSSWCPVHAEMVYTGPNRPRPEALPPPTPRFALMGGRARF
jgi:GcrA cell cycle regulator